MNQRRSFLKKVLGAFVLPFVGGSAALAAPEKVAEASGGVDAVLCCVKKGCCAQRFAKAETINGFMQAGLEIMPDADRISFILHDNNVLSDLEYVVYEKDNPSCLYIKKRKQA